MKPSKASALAAGRKAIPESREFWEDNKSHATCIGLDRRKIARSQIPKFASIFWISEHQQISGGNSEV
jgi:hypothetical protein